MPIGVEHNRRRGTVVVDVAVALGRSVVIVVELAHVDIVFRYRYVSGLTTSFLPLIQLRCRSAPLPPCYRHLPSPFLPPQAHTKSLIFLLLVASARSSSEHPVLAIETRVIQVFYYYTQSILRYASVARRPTHGTALVVERGVVAMGYQQGGRHPGRAKLAETTRTYAQSVDESAESTGSAGRTFWEDGIAGGLQQAIEGLSG